MRVGGQVIPWKGTVMNLSRFRTRRLAVCATVAAVACAAWTAGAVSSSAASAGCSVGYTVSSQWTGGFTASVAITNLGSPVNSWTLTWNFTAGQQVTQGWNATYSQSGTQVTAVSESYNGDLGTGGSTTIGFNGSWNNSANPAMESFCRNGVTCTRGTTPGSRSAPTGTATPTPTRSPTRSLMAMPMVSAAEQLHMVLSAEFLSARTPISTTSSWSRYSFGVN